MGKAGEPLDRGGLKNCLRKPLLLSSASQGGETAALQGISANPLPLLPPFQGSPMEYSLLLFAIVHSKAFARVVIDAAAKDLGEAI